MQTPTIKDQIAEQKRIVAMLEKRAKEQAKEEAKEIAEFKKYQKMVNAGKFLHQQVLRFIDRQSQYGGMVPDETAEMFASYFATDQKYQDLQQHEMIFKMLDFDEAQCELCRAEIRFRVEENDGSGDAIPEAEAVSNGDVEVVVAVAI
jgi:hypothetical protein